MKGEALISAGVAHSLQKGRGRELCIQEEEEQAEKRRIGCEEFGSHMRRLRENSEQVHFFLVLMRARRIDEPRLRSSFTGFTGEDGKPAGFTGFLTANSTDMRYPSSC